MERKIKMEKIKIFFEENQKSNRYDFFLFKFYLLFLIVGVKPKGSGRAQANRLQPKKLCTTM